MTVSIWTRNLKTGEIRKVIEGIKEIIKRNRTRKYTFGVKPNLFEIGPDFANTVIQSTVTEQQWNKVILKSESKPGSISKYKTGALQCGKRKRMKILQGKYVGQITWRSHQNLYKG